MITQPDLQQLLGDAGLPVAFWQWPDETYETVSAQRLREIWAAWVDARPPELIALRPLGGGKTMRIPRWTAGAGDCDNLALGLMAWADVGNAMLAARGEPRGGLACGVLFYLAGPARPENFGVSGGHAINWFVALDRTVRFFEPGVGELVELTTAERSSAWFGLAA